VALVQAVENVEQLIVIGSFALKECCGWKEKRVNDKQWLARRVAIKLVFIQYIKIMVEIRYLHVNFCLNYGMDTFKTSGNQLHGYLKD
jgi:hypothetical protein